MNFQRLTSGTEQTFVLIFDKGDEFISTLTDWATQHEVSSASFTAIGAFERATLGYFDRARKEYEKIEIDEQVEVLSLVGDISLKDEKPLVHAHVVVGKRDGSAHGGHILKATVWPTLEVVLNETPAHLRRVLDEEVGIPLIVLPTPENEID